jgi:hypothetical protein
LVAAAILAANPHNTQPWKFRVSTKHIDVFADRRRRLGHMDPFLREMHIGLGCALENMEQAAGAFGFRVELTLLPGSDPNHVARVALFEAPVRPSALHGWIAERHTDRGAYDGELRVSRALLDAWRAQQSDVVGIALFSRVSGQGRSFAEQTVRATEGLVVDRGMVQDSGRWFRSTPTQVEAHRDGPSVLTAGISPMLATLAVLGPELSAETGHHQWLGMTRDVQCTTAAGFGTLCVSARSDLRAHLEAGRVWQRLHLMGAQHGVSMQPMNQLPEMADRARELGTAEARPKLDRLAARSGAQVTFCFRYGHAQRRAPASARRSLSAVVLPGSVP